MNTEEELEELKKYLIKLRSLINHDAIFSFNNKKIIDKKRIDDILCCVQASIPKEYTNYVKRHNDKVLKTEFCYLELIKAIKNKFLFCNNVYLVYQTEALSKIENLLLAVSSDIKYINQQEKMNK